MTKQMSSEIFGEELEKFRWRTKKRTWQILREEYKIFSRVSKNLVGIGHPTASARHCLRFGHTAVLWSVFRMCLSSSGV